MIQLFMCACSLSRSVVCYSFVTPWTVVHQAPLCMELSGQESWSGSPLPTPWDLPDTRIKPESPELEGRLLTTEPPGKPVICDTVIQNNS